MPDKSEYTVYTGTINQVQSEPDLGASSNVVMQLAQCIPNKGMNH